MIGDPRVLVCSRPEYNFRFENVCGMTFAHSTVLRWGASIKRRWEKDWDTLFCMHGGPIYALYNPETNKPTRHFLEFARFNPFRGISTKDGERVIYVRGQ